MNCKYKKNFCKKIAKEFNIIKYIPQQKVYEISVSWLNPTQFPPTLIFLPQYVLSPYLPTDTLKPCEDLSCLDRYGLQQTMIRVQEHDQQHVINQKILPIDQNIAFVNIQGNQSIKIKMIPVQPIDDNYRILNYDHELESKQIQHAIRKRNYQALAIKVNSSYYKKKKKV